MVPVLEPQPCLKTRRGHVGSPVPKDRLIFPWRFLVSLPDRGRAGLDHVH